MLTILSRGPISLSRPTEVGTVFTHAIIKTHTTIHLKMVKKQNKTSTNNDVNYNTNTNNLRIYKSILIRLNREHF